MIDTSKQYRCRNGCEWRYMETKDDKIIGAVKNQYGYWGIFEWNKNGSYSHSFCNDMDLVEVGPRIKREYWMNVYPYGDDRFGTKESANVAARGDRIACVKIVIDCEEGEGL